MLENFHTHTLKHNKVVSKEHKGLHNQKYYIQSHYLLSAIGINDFWKVTQIDAFSHLKWECQLHSRCEEYLTSSSI